MTTTRNRSLVPQITSYNVVAINKIIIFDITGIDISYNRDEEQE